MLTCGGEVFSLNPGFNRTVSECLDVSVVEGVAHDGGVVMVWTGVCYGQQTHTDPQVHCCAAHPRPSPHVAA